MEAVGADVADFMRGGIIPPDFWEFLHRGGTSNRSIHRRVMGNSPLNWKDPGLFPLHGGPSVGKDSVIEGRDRQLDLSTAKRANKGSGAVGGGDVRPPPP